MADLPPVGAFARMLLALESDPAFIQLSASQTRTNLFRILGTDERERWHSAFWAWLLDPGGSHGLGDLPIRRLLVRAFDETTGAMRASLSLPEVDDDEVRWQAVPDGELGDRALTLSDVLALRVRSAIAAPGPRTAFGEVTSRTAAAAAAGRAGRTSRRSGDDARFDILVMFEATNPRAADRAPLVVFVVVEVKVNAPYDPGQLERYSRWLHAGPSPSDLLQSQLNADFIERAHELVETAARGTPPGGVWSVGLFLSREPSQSLHPRPERLAVPWSTVTFANLVVDVLEPALRHPELDPHARPLLQAYLDLSAHPSTQVLTMPPTEHRELAMQLLERHADTFRILGTVLQKVAQDEDLNQAGATVSGALDQTNPGRDRTKFDVRAGDAVFARLSKRNAMYRVFRSLVDEGASVASLAALPGLKGAFVCLDGTLDRPAFIERAVASRRAFDPSRWFAEDDQIVHQDGRSWVLSNQWGGDVAEVMRRMIATFPGSLVRVEPSTT